VSVKIPIRLASAQFPETALSGYLPKHVKNMSSDRWDQLAILTDSICMWIAASNSSKAYSPPVASIVRPDGRAVRAIRHRTALVTDDFPNAELGWTYDNRTF
jgi:hypothetical protein